MLFAPTQLQPDTRGQPYGRDDDRRHDGDGCDVVDRDDDGFSLAQVLVTMIILGILTVAVGITAFSLIGQGRETVLRANITTAAQAVETTLALNPDALGATDVDGEPSAALLSALSQTAAFNWDEDWVFDDTDPRNASEDTVRVQTLTAAATRTTAAEVPTTAPEAPVVPWLNANGGAVRVQIRNGDGAWMCALIVMRPRGVDADEATRTAEVGRLRGIWYDAGAAIEANGLHNCSPVSNTASAPPGSAVEWPRLAWDHDSDSNTPAWGGTTFRRTAPAIGA